MTMHLAHPALTLGGKRKGKQKFRNAEEAKKARELTEEWKRNTEKWSNMSPKVKIPKDTNWKYSLAMPTQRNTKHIPSLQDTHLGAVTVKKTQQYTGTKIIGIGTMHKSNAVPIFTDEQAVEISTMRRG